MHAIHGRYVETIKQPAAHTFNALFLRIEGNFPPAKRNIVVGGVAGVIHAIALGDQSLYEAFKARCEELRDGVDGITVVEEVAESFLVEAIINRILSDLFFSADESRKAHWLDNNYSLVQAVEQALEDDEITEAQFQGLIAIPEHQLENIIPDILRAGRLYRRFCDDVVAHFLPPPIG